MQYAFLAPLTAFAAALVSVWWLIGSPFSRLALDRPNRRSLHQVPVPRTGGMGMHVGILLAWMLVQPNLPWAIWLATVFLVVVSFADDLFGVPVLFRLTLHMIAAAAAAASLLPDAGPLLVLAVALAIAWMANLFNFMDGSDGLAGGMACFGFSFYAIAAWLSGSNTFAALNFSIAAAAGGFLVFNFHPARIFLGDAGSVPLGFLAAVFGLIGWDHQDWAAWFPALVFSPFIVDASVTLVRRATAREQIWKAHRDHYYQRLVRMGWGHRRTALVEYAWMGGLGTVAVLALAIPGWWRFSALAAVIILHALWIAWIHRAWQEFRVTTER